MIQHTKTFLRQTVNCDRKYCTKENSQNLHNYTRMFHTPQYISTYDNISAPE